MKLDTPWLPVGKRQALRHRHNWCRYLPEAWQDQVVAPLDVVAFREYEMDAERWVGRDGDDLPCYTAHRFVILAAEDRPGPAGTPRVAYSEEMAAWRLRDDRWLVFRMIGAAAVTLPRGFYSISPAMPR